jgi:hypothetical protein
MAYAKLRNPGYCIICIDQFTSELSTMFFSQSKRHFKTSQKKTDHYFRWILHSAVWAENGLMTANTGNFLKLFSSDFKCSYYL